MTIKPKFDWSAAKITRLEELWVKGARALEIASELGTTKNAVISQAHRRGFLHGGVAKEKGDQTQRVKRIAELYEEGVTTVKIAAEFGVAPSTIRSWAIAGGLPARTALAPKPKPVSTKRERCADGAFTPSAPPNFEPDDVTRRHSSARGQDAVLEIGRGQCRWPVGDPRSDDFHFCTAPCKPGSSYCETHHARVYRPVEPLQFKGRKYG